MKITCWAIQTPTGLLKNYDDPLAGFKYKTFKTRKEAEYFQLRWLIQKGKVVKIGLSIDIKEF